jgi:hypothetical protein
MLKLAHMSESWDLTFLYDLGKKRKEIPAFAGVTGEA